MDGIIDRVLARIFHALGFKRCSHCYVRVRRAQLLWFLTRRERYRRVGWPEEFGLRLIVPMQLQEVEAWTSVAIPTFVHKVRPSSDGADSVADPGRDGRARPESVAVRAGERRFKKT